MYLHRDTFDIGMPARALGIGHLVVVLALLASGCDAVARSQQPPAPKVVTGMMPSGDVSLSYLLERPAGPGPYPAVVIGHGSGEARKEDYGFLAKQLLARGFATLRYDKRGVGDSTGTYSMVGIENSERMIPDLAGDMAAGIRLLKSLPDIDASCIGLVGASQAGWIIPVAARMVKPRFMILLVGPTVSVGEEIYYSRFAEWSKTPLSELSGILKKFKGPHGFDPRPVLEDVTTPGLWLLGGADRSIPTPETIAILDDLIARGKPFSKVVFPDADHSLRGANSWAEIDRWLDATKVRPLR